MVKVRNTMSSVLLIQHIFTHPHSDDSKAKDLLRWVLLFLPLDLVSLGKIVPYPPADLYVQDARLSEPRRHIFQLDKLV